MPAEIRAAIDKAGVARAYAAWPRYQRKDDLGRIAAARQDATRTRRLDRMLQEPKTSGFHMGMKHAPSARA